MQIGRQVVIIIVLNYISENIATIEPTTKCKKIIENVLLKYDFFVK